MWNLFQGECGFSEQIYRVFNLKECFEIWFKDSHNTNLKNHQGEFHFSKWISLNGIWSNAKQKNFDQQTWQMNCKATNQNIEKPLYGLENQLFRIGIVHEVLFLQSDLICNWFAQRKSSILNCYTSFSLLLDQAKTKQLLPNRALNNLSIDI